MGKYLTGILLFVIGVLCGATGNFIAFHTGVNKREDATTLFSQILPYSDYEIKGDNYSCEGESSRKVGDIVSSIIGASLTRKVNSLSAGCGDGVCSVVLSNCLPWQSSECGSRMLVVNQSISGEVLPSTFKCLDIP